MSDKQFIENPSQIDLATELSIEARGIFSTATHFEQVDNSAAFFADYCDKPYTEVNELIAEKGGGIPFVEIPVESPFYKMYGFPVRRAINIDGKEVHISSSFQYIRLETEVEGNKLEVNDIEKYAIATVSHLANQNIETLDGIKNANVAVGSHLMYFEMHGSLAQTFLSLIKNSGFIHALQDKIKDKGYTSINIPKRHNVQLLIKFILVLTNTNGYTVSNLPEAFYTFTKSDDESKKAIWQVLTQDKKNGADIHELNSTEA